MVTKMRPGRPLRSTYADDRRKRRVTPYSYKTGALGGLVVGVILLVASVFSGEAQSGLVNLAIAKIGFGLGLGLFVVFVTRTLRKSDDFPKPDKDRPPRDT